MFIFGNLYITVLFVLIVTFYLYQLWKNRRLYYYGSKLEGGLSLPLIGHIYLLIGNSNGKKILSVVIYRLKLYSCYGNSNAVINRIIQYFDKCKGPFVKFWFFNYLCIVPKQPEHLEMLLKGYMEKPSFFYEFLKPVFHNGIITAPFEIWKNHRKIINQSFTQNILNSFVEIFNKHSTELVNDVKEKCDYGHIDIFPVLFRHTTNMICETMMGITSSKSNELDGFVSGVMRLQEMVVLRISKPWRNLFWKLVDGKKTQFDALLIENFVKKIIRLRRLEENQRESDKKYFLNYLIDLENEELTDHEIFEETQTMIIAGSETVAITSSFVLLMMALHPEIQEEAHKEISEILKECGSVTYYSLNKMKYLDRIVKETLRLFPTVPMFARILPEDVHLNSYVLPKGSVLVFFIMNLHRNPEFWPDPLKFNPDRFLPEEIAKRPRGCYVPFSTGPRNCIGFKYAEMSMKILLALFIKSFKITTTRYKVISDIKIQYKLTLTDTNGFKLELKERQ